MIPSFGQNLTAAQTLFHLTFHWTEIQDNQLG